MPDIYYRYSSSYSVYEMQCTELIHWFKVSPYLLGPVRKNIQESCTFEKK